ncbi:PAAR-like domain-containing protein [Vibrio coralliilyticus]|uniref:PAAR-like domain-containing protein n=1 Tax=Vibrio coralliilyticus TaxID=190893 RepID=UPI000C16DD80|nr:PAAR-like domain-containing protein [Vibrio coralliilyticus]
MGVTVCANGLSVVHKGSGGEANATLPDVCLTTVGNAVVPIPYGNNAKSADLADGTTTVSMDGGNSIAIKGSKFAASTGDAGGDKKGVASGTIEAEAEFISASPTVSMEGKGVCRLSDQMTMNKANTMCLGGAQNPSVTVTEDAEGTYTVDLFLSYSDGDPVQGATYKLTDQKGGVFEGKLDDKGKASVSGVAPGEFVIEYGEDSRDFAPNVPTKTNPNFNPNANAQLLIEKTKKGEVGFWENAWKRMSGAASWIWGVILGDFNDDASVEQIIANTALTMIPVVDQAADVRDLSANVMTLLDEAERDKPENWLALSLTLIGCIPTFGSAVKGTCKVALKGGKGTSKDTLLAVLRGLGKGDPEKFLRTLDWMDYAKQASNIISDVLKPCIEVATELASYANRMGADELGSYFLKLADEVKVIDKMVPDKLKEAMGEFDQLFARILGKSERAYPAKVKHDTGKSSQSGKSRDKANEEKDKDSPRCKICKRPAGKGERQCSDALRSKGKAKS